MAHDDQRRPRLVTRPAQQLEDAVPGGRIEPGGRLVEDHHLGPAGQGHGQQDQAPLAARQLAGVAGGGPRAQAHAVQQLVHPPLGPVTVHAQVDLQRLGQLDADPQDRVEGGRRLERQGDPSPPHGPPPLLVEPGQVDVAQDDATLHLRPGHQAQGGPGEGRLPAPRLAQDAQALPGGHGQRDAVQCPHRGWPVVGDGQVDHVEGRLGHRPVRWRTGRTGAARGGPPRRRRPGSRPRPATGGTRPRRGCRRRWRWPSSGRRTRRPSAGGCGRR